MIKALRLKTIINSHTFHNKKSCLVIYYLLFDAAAIQDRQSLSPQLLKRDALMISIIPTQIMEYQVLETEIDPSDAVLPNI